MSNNKKKIKPDETPLNKKKGLFSKTEKPKSTSKKEISHNKRLISSIIIFSLGISLILPGIIFGTSTESYSNPEIVRRKFPFVLLSVKSNLEQHFTELIEEMEDDPLNGLFLDKLPTPEEIFYEEWANDRFPKVDIPTIGGYIEYTGSKAVGDINLDDNPPIADLNISSKDNPSEISIDQCQALWNIHNRYSLVYRSSTNWFKVIQGDINIRANIMDEFNLSDTQLNFICEWINISQYTWIPHYAREERLLINPLPFIGFLGVAGLLIVYSTPKVISEIRKNVRGKKDSKPKGK